MVGWLERNIFMFRIVEENFEKFNKEELISKSDYVIVCSNNNNLEEKRFISYISFSYIGNEIVFSGNFEEEFKEDDDYFKKINIVSYCELVVENWLEDESEVILIRLS